MSEMIFYVNTVDAVVWTVHNTKGKLFKANIKTRLMIDESKRSVEILNNPKN